MVNDPSTDHLIKWNEPNGDSFFVVSSERFGRELLPKYFKHSNFGSFVRQLNMYGFHKVPHLNQGVLQGEIPETEMLEFTNVNFQRGQPDLLCLIQRKKPCPESNNPTTSESIEASSTALPSNPAIPHNPDIQAILVDLVSIRKHQTLMSSDLKSLQSSNAHLWKEAIANRDRIKRCQDTINKILGFLAQVFAGKVSSVQDPPLGNSGPNSSRSGVNLNRNTTNDHQIGILMREGGSMPDLDRHRSRPKSSRDHHHTHTKNLSYDSSPSNTALSLYSQMRHPRLMLEDTQRSSLDPPSCPSQSLTDNVSSFPKSLDNAPSVRHLSLNSSNQNHIQAISSPTPSTRHTSSTSSSPELGQSSQFQDSSIDPNLETVADANGVNSQAVNSNPVPSNEDQSNNDQSNNDQANNDQANADAVLQALFSTDSSTGSFNINDNPLMGINWADLLSSNLNGFNADKSESALNPPSPLRITNGHPSHPVSRPSPSPMDMNLDSCNHLLVNTQRQAGGIESATRKMDSLETAIEKLVNNLPDQMEDYLNPSELDKTNQNGTLYNGPHLSAAEVASDAQADFDADAFLRTLISPEDRSQTENGFSFGNSQAPSAEMNFVPPDEIQTGSMSVVNGKERPDEPSRSQAGDSMDPLDIEKFLDEWTCPDPSRILPGLTPLASPVRTPRLELTETEARLASQNGEISSGFQARGTHPTAGPSGNGTLDQPVHGGIGPKNSGRVAFDLNDDDHFRRIMSSKKSPVDSRLGLPIGHPGSDMSHPHPPRKRLLDDPDPQSSLNFPSNHLNHFSQPSSMNSHHLINNKKTRL